MCFIQGVCVWVDEIIKDVIIIEIIRTYIGKYKFIIMMESRDC